MSSTRGRPILVTGSHRSGSTWVGRVLASHPGVFYVSEPFNPTRPGSPVRHWFQHVTDADAAPFRPYLRRVLTLRHSWWDDFRASPGPRRAVGATRRGLHTLGRRLAGCRPLLKDPIALFAAEWLADAYGSDVVVLIRHPAAFVSSLKRLEWGFLFENLLDQPRLMDDYLRPFAADIRRLAATPHDIMDQAILLWRVFHHVIRRYRRTRPGWVFLRHEDLSLNPLEEFAKLFARLRLTVTPAVRRYIEEHSSEENPSEAPRGVAHQLKRDSKAAVWNWRSRLSPEEVARIRRETEDVARFFYTDADWGPPLAA
jgi:Sulfotransferase family